LRWGRRSRTLGRGRTIDALELRHRPAAEVAEVAAEHIRVSLQQHFAVILAQPCRGDDALRVALVLLALKRILRQIDQKSSDGTHMSPLSSFPESYVNGRKMST
jgi:hypothetical protein